MKNQDGATIQSALDVLVLVDALAQDYEPRSLKDLVAAHEHRGWSQSKIYGMLATLEHAGWVAKREGVYYLTPYLARIAYSYTQHITTRAAALLAEVAAVQGTRVPPPPTPTNPPSEGNPNG